MTDTSKLAAAIEAYARANADKNGAERREKAMKEQVHREMIALKLDHFQTHCEICGNLVAYEATIADVEQDVVDVVKLQGVCESAAFLELVTAPKGAVEKRLGGDIAARVLKTVVKPAQLSISRVRA